MNKEDILERSREENRNGDEFEKAKKETALNNSYFIAAFCLFSLAITCYLGITTGNIIILSKQFNLADILWSIFFLTSAVEYSTKFIYLKQKKHLFLALFWICSLVICLISIARS